MKRGNREDETDKGGQKWTKNLSKMEVNGSSTGRKYHGIEAWQKITGFERKRLTSQQRLFELKHIEDLMVLEIRRF